MAKLSAHGQVVEEYSERFSRGEVLYRLMSDGALLRQVKTPTLPDEPWKLMVSAKKKTGARVLELVKAANG